MKQILIVDTESTEMNVLIDLLSGESEYAITTVSSLDEIPKKLKPSLLIISQKLSPTNYTPVDGVPTILVTGGLPVQSKPFLMAKQLLDTIPDYSPQNCRYIMALLKRTSLLTKVKVLLCEGESLMATMIMRSLKTVGVDTISATSASDVSTLMRTHKNIRLVLVSSSFSGQHGIDVVRKLRKKHSKLELPIVGLIDEIDSDEVEVEFLRQGATDTVRKHLSSLVSMELFRARMMLALQQVISFYEVSQMAERDFLTGAFNRRHFFDAGKALFANYQRGNISLFVAMLDIDNFKVVNDTYGHASGDQAIIALSRTLEKSIRKTDLMARFGGEEFCVVLCGTDPQHGFEVMDRIRETVSKIRLTDEHGTEFGFTVSIGFTVVQADSLEDMVIESDRLLYDAKKSGKNKVISDLLQ